MATRAKSMVKPTPASHREVGRSEICQLVLRRADEHVVHEQRVVWATAHHADLVPALQAVRRQYVDVTHILTVT